MKVEVLTDIFAAWGRQAEKTNPLPERELMKFFEAKYSEVAGSWQEEAEAKARQVEQARQAKLVEERQRAVEEQNARERERQRFEEELNRKRRNWLRNDRGQWKN